MLFPGDTPLVEGELNKRWAHLKIQKDVKVLADLVAAGKAVAARMRGDEGE
ncbi:hypothetical protein HK104_000591 [Borealophlyctis nickersoniae]|nr:hypothetical protein HK104_000591 [Borealophlyctis nickersoniae]